MGDFVVMVFVFAFPTRLFFRRMNSIHRAFKLSALEEALDSNLDGIQYLICKGYAVPQELNQKIANVFSIATLKKITVDFSAGYRSSDEEDQEDSEILPDAPIKPNLSWLTVALKNTKSIKTLCFENAESFDLAELTDALKQNFTVTKIYFRYSEFKEGSVQIFLDYLKECSNIVKLDIRTSKTLKNTVELWRDYLSQTTTLKSLILYSVDIGHINANILFEGLQKNNSLTSLNLASNQIGSKRLAELVNIVLSKPHLIRLNISFIEVRSYEGAAALYKLLKASYLERLEMCYNFTKEDTELLTKLVEALQYDRRLKYLSMSEYLDSNQSRKVAEWIQLSNSIETLKLSLSHFDENACKIFGAAIRHHKSLKIVQMMNGIFDGSDSLEWIIAGLKTNTSIQEFCTAPLQNFELTAKCVDLICDVLKTNDSLVTFRLSNVVAASKEFGEKIFNALSMNHAIEDFLLDSEGMIRHHTVCDRNKCEKEELQRDWWILSHNIARTMIRYTSPVIFPIEIWPVIFSHIKYRGLSSFQAITRKAFIKYNINV